MFALRDGENDELVTNDNLRKKILGKANLKYVFDIMTHTLLLNHCAHNSIDSSMLPPLKRQTRWND